MSLRDLIRVVDASGTNLGDYTYDKKPDWTKVMKFLGTETQRDASYLGKVKLTFSSGAEMFLNTPSIIVEYKPVDSNIRYAVYIDGESDIQLMVDSLNRLENPSVAFVPIFKAIGLDKSLLNSFKFEERLRLEM